MSRGGRQQYLCIDGFCGCYQFQSEVLQRGSQMYCKHLLAMRIARATKMHMQRGVSPAVFAEILRNQV